MPFKKPDNYTLALAAIGGVVLLASAGLAAWLYTTSSQPSQRPPHMNPATGQVVTGKVEPAKPNLQPMPKALDDMMAGITPDIEKPAQTFKAIATPKYVSNAEAGLVAPKGEPKIAIVIDDVGVNTTLSRKADKVLPPEVTFSFLPYGSATMELAKKARKEGREVMIHLPMEPMPRLEEPPIDPGPDALYVDLDPAEIKRRTLVNLAELKDLSVGVNNHMGSRFTADERGMEEVLKIIDAEGLFFLDSLTTNQSAVEAAAKKVAPTMPLLKRDVFLDHYITEEALTKALLRLEKEAKQKGHAIAIGHPHNRTLRVLQDWLPTLPYKGITLVPVTHLLPNHKDPVALTPNPTPVGLPEGMKAESATPETNIEEQTDVQPADHQQPEPAHVRNPRDPNDPSARLY